jgi:hypothetical protein
MIALYKTLFQEQKIETTEESVTQWLMKPTIGIDFFKEKEDYGGFELMIF